MKWAKAFEAMTEGWRVSRPRGPELQKSFGGVVAKQPGGSWADYEPTSADRASEDWVVIGEKEY